MQNDTPEFPLCFHITSKNEVGTKGSVPPLLNKGKCAALYKILSSLTVAQCNKSHNACYLLSKSELRT